MEDESSPDSGPVRRAKSRGREKRRGLDGVLWGRLKSRLARQKPKKLSVSLSLVAACDVRVNGNYVRGWNVTSGVFLYMEVMSRYRSCIM